MNKKLKTILWATLFLSVVILVVRGSKNNPDWQAFSWHGFLEHLVHVQKTYLLLSLGITLLTYLLRALRWREFLIPIKRTSLGNLWSAVVIGFSAVCLLGRAGELTRPFILSRKENLPISLSLTTVVMERLFDFSTLLTIFLANLFFFHLSSSVSRHNALVFHLFARGAAVMLVVMSVITLLLFLFQTNAVRWIDFVIDRVGMIPVKMKHKVENGLKSFVEGLAFVAHPRPLFFSLVYSFALWLSIVLGSYFIILGFGIPFTFSMAVVLLAFSAMGAVIQLPGVGGGYQALTLYALVSLLGVDATVASGITLVSWVISFFPVVGIGLVDLLRGGMSLRSLTSAAEREVETALTDSPPVVEEEF